jgi:hypothetical protein
MSAGSMLVTEKTCAGGLMQYYIKEWSDQTASLIAEDGYSLDLFENVYDAIDACIYDCMVEPEYIERHNNYLGASPLDFESSFI